MVNSAEFRALAAESGIELRRDPDVIMTPTSSLDEFIDLAEGLGLVILGLDGFRLDGAVVVPLLDFIADFSAIEGSWASRVRASASEARLARDWEAGTELVEVTLEGFGG
jgi:hypothetical protein